MSTTVALSSMAATQSAIAANQAAQAKTAACKALVTTYKHESSTVAEMREYADCVYRLHPSEMSPDVLIALKVLVFLLLVSMPIGGWVMRYEDWSGRCAGVVAAPCIVALVALVIWLIGAGVLFLFGAL